MAFIAVSGCRDIFYSKENIEYMDLIIDKEYLNSVSKKNYYKFHAEQGVTYYLSWKIVSSPKIRINVEAFWYDTGEIVAEGWGKKLRGGLSFSYSRSGDVVIRITGRNDYKIILSTSGYNYEDNDEDNYVE